MTEEQQDVETQEELIQKGKNGRPARPKNPILKKFPNGTYISHYEHEFKEKIHKDYGDSYTSKHFKAIAFNKNFLIYETRTSYVVIINDIVRQRFNNLDDALSWLYKKTYDLTFARICLANLYKFNRPRIIEYQQAMRAYNKALNQYLADKEEKEIKEKISEKEETKSDDKEE